MLYYKEWLDEKPKGLGESADNYKNRKEEVFEFEPNQSNLRVLLTYCMRSREKLSKPKWARLRNRLLLQMAHEKLKKMLVDVKTEKKEKEQRKNIWR